MDNSVKKIWKLFDVSFFGNKTIKNFTNDMVLIERYYTIKSCLLTEVFELSKMFKCDRNKINNISNKKIIENAKLLTYNILNTKKAKKIIKENVKNYLTDKITNDKDIDVILNTCIKETTLSIYIDNLLIFPFIKENKNFQNIKYDDNMISIVRSSYNFFKTEMINIIMEISKSKSIF